MPQEPQEGEAPSPPAPAILLPGCAPGLFPEQPRREFPELDDPGEPLACARREKIPAALLSCEQDDCEDFEEDEKQALLFEGLL